MHPAGRIDGVDGLADGRVAEAEGDLRVFERDRRIDAGRVADEFLDARRHRARVLVDGRVLVFHFDDQLGRVEHLVGVPGDRAVGVQGSCRRRPVVAGVDLPVRAAARESAAPSCSRRARRSSLEVLDLIVVLLVEDVVDRGQAEVLVHAAVTGDVVVADRLPSGFR